MQKQLFDCDPGTEARTSGKNCAVGDRSRIQRRAVCGPADPEVVAHRVGEPVGTLILALAVTAIETALILSMMIAGGSYMAVLARDSIYAAV